jgi:hypothetical protein
MRFFFLICLLALDFLFAQAVYEPIYLESFNNRTGSPISSSVYKFLNRLSIKGAINYNDELLPLTRKYIAKRLIEAENNITSLTILEKKELVYFKQEFYYEIETFNENAIAKILIFKEDKLTGFRPFLYIDDNFSITADPILGISYRNQYKDNFSHRFNGLIISGNYDRLGFNFYFRDNEESGRKIDFRKSFSSEPGIAFLKASEESLEYSDVRGMVSYAWDWGSFDFSKDYLQWGSGIGGQLIFSNKAPSFPFIRLNVLPVEWLHFQYIHGSLHSGIIDPSSIRETHISGRKSFNEIDKFIVAHIVSLYPYDNVSLSLGESIVYSHKLEPLYFIPIIFFRPADHYLSDSESNSGDNAQIFLNGVYKNTLFRFKLYGTIFVDELSITDILRGGNLSAIGYTLGSNLIDPFIENSELVLEFTRIDPFVYLNWNDVELYTNHRYQLGHWIGSNAEHYYVSYTQWLLKGLSVKAEGNYVRKGQTEIPEQQYQIPYPGILYGSRLSYKSVSLEVGFVFYRKLFARLSYQYSDINDEETGRVPLFQLGVNHSFGISLGYGL